MTSATTFATHSGSQPGGLLFKLPPELRLEIYELVFPRENVSIFAVRKQLLKAPNAKVSAGNCVALLATCRTIHDEAKAALYANTHFDIYCSLELAPGAWRAAVEEKWGPWQWLPRMNTEEPVDIQQARNIDINVKFTTEALSKSWGNTWLDNLPAHMSSFSNLKSLHIKLLTAKLNPVDVKRQADHVLPLLAKLKCTGRITAAMDVSLGDVGFETASYDAMCRTVKVTDKTQEVYTKELAVLSIRHESIFNELVILSTRLNSRTSERIEIVKEEGWRKRSASRARARELKYEMRLLSQNIFKLQKRLDRTQNRSRELEQRRVSLLVRA